jgi:cysteine desulfurase/selenocysteine lyase
MSLAANHLHLDDSGKRSKGATLADRVRGDFPILARRVHGKPLVYLDNAASAQKPRQVIDVIRRVYEESYSNIHRGVHALSQEATRLYEDAREKARKLLGAASTREIVFTSGTTGAINLVAQSYARPRLAAGDEILITGLEHHSNIVPWQLLCEQTGALLKVAPITDDGQVVMDAFMKLLNPKTRLIAVAHVSNALGTINPVKAMIDAAHAVGAAALVDGAQSAPHLRVDMRELDCDFFAFSGHKIYGPTGIGVLYAKEALLKAMPPYQGGGDMISSVTFEKSTWNELPYKFEAGTPNIAGGIGLGAAIDYVQAIGLDAIAAYENDLLAYTIRELGKIDRVRLIGHSPCRASVQSFVIEGIHPHDIGTVLDQEGVAIRTGHHCAQPVMDRLGVPATARASLAFYNTRGEIDALAAGVRKAIEVLG